MLETTDATFEQDVLQSDKIVLVDFWAPWCMPCQVMGPVLDKLAAARPDIKIVKIDIDQSPQTAKNYSVRGIPNFILFKDGQVIGQKNGAQPGSKLSAWIDEALQAQASPVPAEPAQPEPVAPPEDPAKTVDQTKVNEVMASVKKWSNRSKITSCGLQAAGGLCLAALGSPALLPLILGGIVAAGQGMQVWRTQTQNPKKASLWNDSRIQAGLGIATAAAGILTFGVTGGLGTAASLGIGTLATVMTVGGTVRTLVHVVVIPALVKFSKKALEKAVAEAPQTPAPQLAPATPAPKAPSPGPSPDLESAFKEAHHPQPTGNDNTKAQEQTPPAPGQSPKL